MKKRLIILGILICIFLFFSIVGLSNEVKYDFRKTNWGMSIEQVKAIEDKKPEWESDSYIGSNGTGLITVQEGKSLEYYPVEINGKNYTCQYVFLENKLYRGRYRSFGIENIREYEIIKGLLNKKYGKAKTDREIWFNTLFKGDSFYLEDAIKSGHLIYVARWETSTTDIELKLSNDNSRIMMTVTYWSKELSRQKKQKEEKERMDLLKEEENKSNL